MSSSRINFGEVFQFMPLGVHLRKPCWQQNQHFFLRVFTNHRFFLSWSRRSLWNFSKTLLSTKQRANFLKPSPFISRTMQLVVVAFRSKLLKTAVCNEPLWKSPGFSYSGLFKLVILMRFTMNVARTDACLPLLALVFPTCVCLPLLALVFPTGVFLPLLMLVYPYWHSFAPTENY